MGILSDRQIRAENIVSPCEPCATRPGKISYGLTSYGYDARIGYKFRVFKPYPATVIDPKAFDERMFETVDLTPSGRVAVCKACSGAGKAMLPCSHCAGESGVIPYITIPPHSFVLGETVETFTIPRDTLAVVLGKSTYARCGLIVNCTPLEPEWHGVVTVELSNTTPLPLKVYCGEGIMQVVFLRSDGQRASDAGTLADLRQYLFDDEYGPLVPRLIPLPTGRGHPDRSCLTSYADKKGRYQGQTGVTPPTVDLADCKVCAGKGTNRAGQACIQCDATGGPT